MIEVNGKSFKIIRFSKGTTQMKKKLKNKEKNVKYFCVLHSERIFLAFYQVAVTLINI